MTRAQYPHQAVALCTASRGQDKSDRADDSREVLIASKLPGAPLQQQQLTRTVLWQASVSAASSVRPRILTQVERSMLPNFISPAQVHDLAACGGRLLVRQCMHWTS